MVGAGRSLLALVVVVMLRWTPSSKITRSSGSNGSRHGPTAATSLVEARASEDASWPACGWVVIGQGSRQIRGQKHSIDPCLHQSQGGTIYTRHTHHHGLTTRSRRPEPAIDRSEIAHATTPSLLAPDLEIHPGRRSGE